MPAEMTDFERLCAEELAQAKSAADALMAEAEVLDARRTAISRELEALSSRIRGIKALIPSDEELPF